MKSVEFSNDYNNNNTEPHDLYSKLIINNYMAASGSAISCAGRLLNMH